MRTNGTHRYFRGARGGEQRESIPLSLCLLYQDYHCSQGVMCNQAHVQRRYVRRILEALQAVENRVCCLHHGDPYSLSSAAQPLWDVMSRLPVVLVRMIHLSRSGAPPQPSIYMHLHRGDNRTYPPAPLRPQTVSQ